MNTCTKAYEAHTTVIDVVEGCSWMERRKLSTGLERNVPTAAGMNDSSSSSTGEAVKRRVRVSWYKSICLIVNL